MEKRFVVDTGKENMEIRKVLLRSDGVKYLIVPKHSKFQKNKAI